MAGKKGAAIQLQLEVATDEEWENMLQKSGLIVVDVYTGWCGPCVGMVGNLKKIKLEIGGDMLHLAIAKSDGISCLERFRNKSEPTWMFISGGKMVNLMFGANSPRLMKLITDELQKETEVQRGFRDRAGMPFTEYMPEEITRSAMEEEKEAAKRSKTEAAEKQAQEKKYQQIVKKLSEELKQDSVVVCLPFVQQENIWPPFVSLMDALGSSYLVKQETLVTVDLETAQKLFDIYDEELVEELKEQLEKGPCMAKLIGLPGKPEPSTPDEKVGDEPDEPEIALVPSDTAILFEDDEEKEEENVVALIHDLIYKRDHTSTEQEDDEEEGEDGETPTSILAQVLSQFADVTSVPGIWAASTPQNMADTVIAFFPDYVQEIMGPEPEPPPPHVAVVFDVAKIPEISETLNEFQDDIINAGFFDGFDPDTSRKIASSLNEFHLVTNKTGNEKFVLMLNNTKNDALLELAQFGPKYISQNIDEGKEDCEKFFPTVEDQESMELTAAAITDADVVIEKEFDTITFDSHIDNEMADYDPLALRAEVAVEEEDITSVVSGFDMGSEMGSPKRQAEAPPPVEEAVLEAVADAVKASEEIKEGYESGETKEGENVENPHMGEEVTEAVVAAVTGEVIEEKDQPQPPADDAIKTGEKDGGEGETSHPGKEVAEAVVIEAAEEAIEGNDKPEPPADETNKTGENVEEKEIDVPPPEKGVEAAGG